jgi:hypothetical protein
VRDQKDLMPVFVTRNDFKNTLVQAPLKEVRWATEMLIPNTYDTSYTLYVDERKTVLFFRILSEEYRHVGIAFVLQFCLTFSFRSYFSFQSISFFDIVHSPFHFPKTNESFSPVCNMLLFVRRPVRGLSVTTLLAVALAIVSSGGGSSRVLVAAMKKTASEISPPPPSKLGLCDYDCDTDADCATGLLCADAHKPELAAINKDVRKVNCGNVGAWNEEVCFPASVLTTKPPNGNGGGGTSIPYRIVVAY